MKITRSDENGDTYNGAAGGYVDEGVQLQDQEGVWGARYEDVIGELGGRGGGVRSPGLRSGERVTMDLTDTTGDVERDSARNRHGRASGSGRGSEDSNIGTGLGRGSGERRIANYSTEDVERSLRERGIARGRRNRRPAIANLRSGSLSRGAGGRGTHIRFGSTSPTRSQSPTRPGANNAARSSTNTQSGSRIQRPRSPIRRAPHPPGFSIPIVHPALLSSVPASELNLHGHGEVSEERPTLGEDIPTIRMNPEHRVVQSPIQRPPNPLISAPSRIRPLQVSPPRPMYSARSPPPPPPYVDIHEEDEDASLDQIIEKCFDSALIELKSTYDKVEFLKHRLLTKLLVANSSPNLRRQVQDLNRPHATGGSPAYTDMQRGFTVAGRRRSRRRPAWRRMENAEGWPEDYYHTFSSEETLGGGLGAGIGNIRIR